MQIAGGVVIALHLFHHLLGGRVRQRRLRRGEEAEDREKETHLGTIDGIAGGSIQLAKSPAPSTSRGFAPLARADDAVALHPLDQPRGAVVADLQPALDHRDRRQPRLAHQPHRLVVELVVRFVRRPPLAAVALLSSRGLKMSMS